MSPYRLGASARTRACILASAAVVSLVAACAFGESELTSSHAAHAAAVVNDDLPGPTMPSFASLISRVKPAVVSVKVKIVRDADDEDDGQRELPPQVQQFFHHFGQQDHPQQQVLMGEGSGFFISSDGYIVTNNHVVQNSKAVTVTMDDGRVLDAKVVGTDPKTDLAVLKVSQPGDYPYVSFAKEEPRIGDWVVAIGNPYGLGGTVTAGIISADGRDIGDGPYDRFLQIDAPINKGNSGGPTFNTEGQVVGVNTAIYSPSGGSIGIGFDIPARTVDQVVTALEHGGVVKRGYLGVRVQPVGPDIAEGLGLKTAEGAIVDDAIPGTPAANAGLESGDVITEIGGKTVKDASDLTLRIGSMKPGDKVNLSFLRDGATKSAEITLASQPGANVAKAKMNETVPAGRLGMQLAPASEASGANRKGVVIVGVDPNGEAAVKGLQSGDVVLDVGGKPVTTPDDVKADIASARSNGAKAVLMRVQTSQGDRFVAFAFPKA